MKLHKFLYDQSLNQLLISNIVSKTIGSHFPFNIQTLFKLTHKHSYNLLSNAKVLEINYKQVIKY